jgi:hypothetical protein
MNLLLGRDLEFLDVRQGLDEGEALFFSFGSHYRRDKKVR